MIFFTCLKKKNYFENKDLYFRKRTPDCVLSHTNTATTCFLFCYNADCLEIIPSD